jgi:hypothetical protein
MRNEILNHIISDISRIRISNGYNHDAPEADKYFFTADDVSVAPRISARCDSQYSTPTEAGLDTTLKLSIITHIAINNDIGKSGKMTEEAEKWIEDYEKLFSHPSAVNADPAKISTLWSIGGVSHYYISAVEPFTDRNENRHTLNIELTVNYLTLT